MVSEKKTFVCFSHCKYMGANASQGGAIFDPRDMTCRATSFGSSGFRKDFFMDLLYRPRVWSIRTSGALLARFMKGTTKHCYIQNRKALGFVVSKKIFFMFLSL